MAKFQMKPIVGTEAFTARLGAGTGSGNFLTDPTEKGKFVKLVGESRYDLAAVGDEIEGQISSINAASQDNYSVGAVIRDKYVGVTFDGLQGTPGTGTIAVGDYVLVGTPVVKGTALTVPPKVVKATTQASAKSTPFAARVVSLGSAGTGAVGTTGVIELVNRS